MAPDSFKGSLTSNEIKLYGKYGFEKIGTHKNFFNIDGNYYDEILMDLYI